VKIEATENFSKDWKWATAVFPGIGKSQRENFRGLENLDRYFPRLGGFEHRTPNIEHSTSNA
jgi:hypothetical protein